MKTKHWITVLILLICWYLFALYLSNDILLPLPSVVLERMLLDFTTQDFFIIVFTTFRRTLIGLLIALGMALILGLASSLNKTLKELLSPLIIISKTIPNISYIFIILVWFSREISVTIIAFLILFPVLYATITSAMDQFNQELKDVLLLYPEKTGFTLRKLYLPHLFPFVLNGLKTAFGLGLKVSVMAEILGQVQVGIGKQLYLCRINLDMIGIFAWTIWIILLCVGVEMLFRFFLNRLKVSI